MQPEYTAKCWCSAMGFIRVWSEGKVIDRPWIPTDAISFTYSLLLRTRCTGLQISAKPRLVLDDSVQVSVSGTRNRHDFPDGGQPEP
ncbi:hypothetical protein SUGI_1190070 [Cryptomeria japonica]|nr:hypothetical protein SUGI_1190070 [Cryptomeria japonica]